MPQDNGTFTPEEVEAVKAQLAQELQTRDQAIAGLEAQVKQAAGELAAQLQTRDQAIAQREQALAERDAAIAAMTSELTALKEAAANAAGDIETRLKPLQEGLRAAAGKYRALLVGSNPGIPDELVQGEDVEALDASMEKARAIVEKARAIVEKVRAAMADAAAHAAVPPGAPPRSAPDVESLSAVDKIKYALRGK